jgi:hypothetical protein
MGIKTFFSFILDKLIFNPVVPGSLLAVFPLVAIGYMSLENQQYVLDRHQKIQEAIYVVASPDDDTLSIDESVAMLAGVGYTGTVDLKEGIELNCNLYGVLMISGENRAIIDKDHACKYIKAHFASLPQDLKGLEYCLDYNLPFGGF